MTLATASLASALGIAAAMLALWLLSLRLRDASIVDIFWGAGFAGVGLGCALAGDGFATRRLLVGGLAALWGLRLAFYLFQRNHGNGEDPRYQSMRRRSRKNPPVGPSSPKVASHTGVSAASSGEVVAPAPPMRVRTHPRHTALTLTPRPAPAASFTVRALRAALLTA